MSKKKKPLSTVLQFLSQKYLRLHPQIRSWSFAHSQDASVLLHKIQLDTSELILRYSDNLENKCWKNTSHFTISIQQGDDSLFHHNTGRIFLKALQKLDDGSIEMDQKMIPKNSTTPSHQPIDNHDPKDLEEKNKSFLAEHEKRKELLHWLAYIGLKSTTTMDLYPHIKPLGEPISTENIVDQWKNTLDLMKKNKAPQKLGMYTHAPFCAVACTFCYCGKTDQFDKKLFKDYLSWLHREIDLFAPLFANSTFTSWYFGGGTPSVLPSGVMRDLFDMMHQYFYVEPNTQIIFEGNPDSLNDRKIEVLHKHGKVTRLTIGLQTLDEKVQKLVRRHNKPHHIQQAVKSARRWDIQHVNIDLMAGLPEQSLESFKADVEFVLSLQPDSVHINPFRPLPRVGLKGFTKEQYKIREQMRLWGKKRLQDAGHTSGLPGQSARKTKDASNIQEYDLRTQNSSLLGLGYGAFSHSFAGSWYIPTIERDFTYGLSKSVYNDWRWTGVPSSIEEEMHKFVIRNFNSSIDRKVFVDLFGVDCVDVFREAFETLVSLGVIDIKEDKIRYTGLENAWIVYRGLLYSAPQMERVQKYWGADYNPDEDIYSKLRLYLEGFNFPC